MRVDAGHKRPELSQCKPLALRKRIQRTVSLFGDSLLPPTIRHRGHTRVHVGIQILLWKRPRRLRSQELADEEFRCRRSDGALQGMSKHCQQRVCFLSHVFASSNSPPASDVRATKRLLIKRRRKRRFGRVFIIHFGYDPAAALRTRRVRKERHWRVCRKAPQGIAPRASSPGRTCYALATTLAARAGIGGS